jgi:hypothetical protein
VRVRPSTLVRETVLLRLLLVGLLILWAVELVTVVAVLAVALFKQRSSNDPTPEEARD